MHEGKQVKEPISRVIQQAEGGSVQQFRLEDNLGSSVVQGKLKSNVCNIRHVECGTRQRVAMRDDIRNLGIVQRNVGFEFQMLESEVELFNKNKQCGITWGNPNGWKIEKDGENIEFITNMTFSNTEADNAKKITNEIVKAAGLIKNKGTYKQEPQKKNNETNRIQVLTPDTAGQPQINADINIQHIENRNDWMKIDNPEYQSAECFGWNAIRTNQILKGLEEIRKFICTLNMTDIFEALNIRPSADEQNLKFNLIKSYLITNLYIRFYAPTRGGLTKDLPILPKVDFKSIENLIQYSQEKSEEKDKLETLIEKYYTEIETILKTNKVHSSDFYEEETGKKCVYGVKNPKSIVMSDTYSMLMEYRRVPVLNVDQWANFAEKATLELGGLKT